VARRGKPQALVTGGDGFVGSHHRERLLSEGCERRAVPAHRGPKKSAGWFAERLADRWEVCIGR
jgi:nucleoside-diphosphate-sugar epimerase